MTTNQGSEKPFPIIDFTSPPNSRSPFNLQEAIFSMDKTSLRIIMLEICNRSSEAANIATLILDTANDNLKRRSMQEPNQLDSPAKRQRIFEFTAGPGPGERRGRGGDGEEGMGREEGDRDEYVYDYEEEVCENCGEGISEDEEGGGGGCCDWRRIALARMHEAKEFLDNWDERIRDDGTCMECDKDVGDGQCCKWRLKWDSERLAAESELTHF